MGDTAWILIAFIVYAAVMVLIGLIFFKRTSNLSDYFLGGRNLNSWVGALSAQASDMSGWLLMGLPGALYAFGTGQMWIAVGLAVGTILNWIFVAKRLRRYTIKAGDSITIPQYFENRFRDGSGGLRIASALVFMIFFAVYTASAFTAGAVLFSQVFGISFEIGLLISAGIILVYTFMGGFSAVCWTDFIQGLLMLIAILAVPIIALVAMNGFSEVSALVSPGFLDIMSDGNGNQFTLIDIISQLAWGLGYFGMPHIIVRFMAIKSEKAVSKSAVIAIVWVLFSLCFAVLIGILGVAFVPGLENSETVFIEMIQKIFMGSGAIISVPLIGGLFLCGILAAIMSTADSQLLVTASSMTGDIYQKFNKKASDKHLVWVSRISVLIVAVVAFFIALSKNDNIMGLVSNAWAGFGAAFGPLVLLSLYWKRVNRAGAVAGIVSGAAVVILWTYIPLIKVGDVWTTLEKKTGLYSLVLGFVISFVLIVVCSLLTKEPSREIQEEFDAVSDGRVE